MSETKKKLTINQKLAALARGRKKIPDEFWVDGAVWFHDASTGGYSWSAERIGMDRDGNIVWAFDSGCSCNSPWEAFDITKCEKVEPKRFVLSKFTGERYGDSYDGDSYTPPEEIEKGIDEFLLLVRADVKPKEVLSALNAEIRRYLIKRIGYDKIKKAVNATVLHKDGKNELLKFASGEMYVKVRDSSTKRDYLLYVEGRHETCRSAIAWTFGLSEAEYQPEIET